jgi:glycosyltransferase
MDIGGESNKSIKNIFIKSKEDYLAIKRNNIGNFLTILFKNLRKVRQFNKFRNSKISC